MTPRGGPMTVSAMPADQFWQIVERAARSDHDPDAHVEALRVALRREFSRKKMAKAACWTMPSRESDFCLQLGLLASLSRKTTRIWPGATRISGDVSETNRLAEAFIDPWTALGLRQGWRRRAHT